MTAPVQNWTQSWRKQVWSFLLSASFPFFMPTKPTATHCFCEPILVPAAQSIHSQVCSRTMSEWTPSYSWLWSWATLRMCAPVSQLHVSIMSTSLLYMLSSKYSTWALFNLVNFKNSCWLFCCTSGLWNLGFIPVRAILTHLSECPPIP